MNKYLLMAAVIIAAGPLTDTGHAQEMPNYGEIAVGWSSISIDRDQYVRNALTVTSTSKSELGYSVRYGRRLSPVWGFELAYIDAGYVTVRGTTSTGTPWSAHVHARNYTLGATARHAFNDKLGVFGRVGGLTFENNFGKSPSVQRLLHDQERGVGLYYGAGLEWKLAGRSSLSGAVDRYDGVYATTVVSAGVRIAF